MMLEAEEISRRQPRTEDLGEYLPCGTNMHSPGNVHNLKNILC